MRSHMEAPRPLSVLVVIDSPDAGTLARLLRMHGFDARSAVTGADALAATDDAAPDVVLMDPALPGVTGYELARQLRDRTGAFQKRPLLVAVADSGDEEERRLSAAAGIDLHLVKPLDPAALVGMLSRFHEFLAAPAGGDPAGDDFAEPDQIIGTTSG